MHFWQLPLYPGSRYAGLKMRREELHSVKLSTLRTTLQILWSRNLPPLMTMTFFVLEDEDTCFSAETEVMEYLKCSE